MNQTTTLILIAGAAGLGYYLYTKSQSSGNAGTGTVGGGTSDTSGGSGTPATGDTSQTLASIYSKMSALPQASSQLGPDDWGALFTQVSGIQYPASMLVMGNNSSAPIDHGHLLGRAGSLCQGQHGDVRSPKAVGGVKMQTTLLLVAFAGLVWWLSTQASSSGAPTGTGVPSGAPQTGTTDSGTGGSNGTTSSSGTQAPQQVTTGSVLPPPSAPVPPANPIQTGVPIQTAGTLAGLYSLISNAAEPGSLKSAGEWNLYLGQAWYEFSFATGIGAPAQNAIPDPADVFVPLYPGFDGSQLMDLPTYWSAASAYLKQNAGLSGFGSWAV